MNAWLIFCVVCWTVTGLQRLIWQEQEPATTSGVTRLAFAVYIFADVAEHWSKGLWGSWHP